MPGISELIRHEGELRRPGALAPEAPFAAVVTQPVAELRLKQAEAELAQIREGA
jgi:hypothetical protein